MPIFDQGYQHWKGQRSGHAWRWWTITRHGVRALSRSWWTRIAVLAAWLPAMALVGTLIVWGLFEQKSSLITPFLALLRQFPPEIQGGPRNFRVSVWTMAFDLFFSVEMTLWMILVLIVGPGLVSRDLRFNALPLYLSRPLRRIDYFLGKLGVIAFYLALVTTGPALAAYVLGVCFSLDLSVVRDTARVLAAVIAYGLIVTVSAGTLMLAVSSLSRNSLYVGGIWAGLWIVSGTVAGVLVELVRKPWCSLVSYGRNLQHVGSALLGRQAAIDQFARLAGPSSVRGGRPDFPPQAGWYWSALILLVLLGLSVWILTSRVRSLDRLR